MVSPTIVQVLSDLYPTSNRRLPACAVRAVSHRARALAGGDTMIGVRASALPGTYLATARPRCVAASALPTRARFTTRSLIPAGTYLPYYNFGDISASLTNDTGPLAGTSLTSL